MFPPIETPRRLAVLRRTWKLCERQFDEDVLEGALAGTSALTVEQLEAACGWVVQNDPKGPLLRGILDAVDKSTRIAQSRHDAEREFWCVPAVNIDPHRERTQHAILNAWKKPASQAQWSQENREALRGELEADSPALSAYNAKVRADLAHYAKFKRFPAKEAMG